MDENPSKPRSRWLRFSLRDLLWLVLTLGLALGWWLDHRSSDGLRDHMRALVEMIDETTEWRVIVPGSRKDVDIGIERKSDKEIAALREAGTFKGEGTFEHSSGDLGPVHTPSLFHRESEKSSD